MTAAPGAATAAPGAATAAAGGSGAATGTSAVRAAAGALARIPPSMAHPIADRLGRLAAVAPAVGRPGRAIDGRRRMLRAHLERVYGPGHAAGWLDARVRDGFGSYGRYWAESLRLAAAPEAERSAGTSRTGFEHLEAALAAGRGAVLALPHLGGWDWGGAYLATLGIGVTAVMERLRSDALFDWFAGLRRSVGIDVVPVGTGASAACLRALQANRVVCLLSDRAVPGVGAVDVELFGAPAALPAGPAVLALRSGAPLLPAAVYLAPRRGHRAVVLPPVPVGRAGRFGDDVRAATARLATAFETLIAADPTQWHALSPIWRDDEPFHGAGRPAGGER